MKKLCRDCRHFRGAGSKPWFREPDDFYFNHARCAALTASHNEGVLEYVAGRPSTEGGQYCNWARASDGECGPEGRLWEPR